MGIKIKIVTVEPDGYGVEITLNGYADSMGEILSLIGKVEDVFNKWLLEPTSGSEK
jgi:hypothetical protein